MSQPGYFPQTAVIGANGFLGSHFLRALRKFYPDCSGTTREDMDLSAPDIGPLRLRESGDRDAIIAAAITGVAHCEQDSAGTRACNVAGTLELARQLTAVGVVPIFFSSDYVFDGARGGYADDAVTYPINEYGRQKAEVERRLWKICDGDVLIIRLSKVFGLDKGDGTLLDEMASRLSQGLLVRAACDQIFCPVLVDDVVKMVMALQQARATGIINVCSPEAWRRLDLALAMADVLDVDGALVQEISLDDLGEPFRRPKRTNLICQRLRETADIEFVPTARCIEQVARNYRRKIA
ncbi:MAG: sugar nucleotide-binding protein [Candidatus Poribacteria bacterium]|nr:sugar nucleotide-binding protein [Candidatus Poribacteria bacterium]